MTAGTIIVSILLLGMITAIIRKLHQDKKKQGCGGGCASCSHCKH